MLVKIKGDVRLFSYAAVGGAQEAKGPLGKQFDLIDESERFRQKTWEQSEGEMQRIALLRAMDKASICDKDVGHLFAGDLMNQCTSSSYGLMSYDIPYIGLYGACSTAAESIALASIMCDMTGSVSAAVTSSHFCSAERQFRYPLEYGGQRTPTSQRTVTGSGAFLLGQSRGKIRVKEVMFGRSVDSKINDICNMGAAMAPAAVDTLSRFFEESGSLPQDYDKIVTGDLGREGFEITKLMMAQKGYNMDAVYDDCGLLIYNIDVQDMHAGGSGCGCSAVVAATSLFPSMARKEIRNLLLVGTGALMSPTSMQQGLSIASIAHLVHFEVV